MRYRTRDVLAEAWSSAISQRVASVVTMVMVAGMCAAVLLTAGRTAAAKESVLATLDDAGTRSIVVRTTAGAILDSGVVKRIERIGGVQWVAGFGPAHDVVNSAFRGGSPVGVRTVTAGALSLPAASSESLGLTVYASEEAQESLGMLGSAGGLVDSDQGTNYSLAGTIKVPEYLEFLEPLAVTEGSDGSRKGVSVLVVIAEEPALVAPLTTATKSLLGAADDTKVSVTTSKALASLRGLVELQLSGFSRALTAAIFSLTAVLVAAILFGLVMLKRKDYGRRRALGASRSLIVALVLVQTSIPACIGAILGSCLAVTVLVMSIGASPTLEYLIAVGVCALMTACTAALVPAIAASRRQPITELRIA